MKSWSAHVPDTGDHEDPESVDRSDAKVGDGVTSVVGDDAHFQPIVPPELPVRTMKYLVAAVKVRGGLSTKVRYSSAQDPIDRFDTALAMLTLGEPAFDDQIDTEYDPAIEAVFDSLELRIFRAMDVTDESLAGDSNDCANQVVPDTVRHGPSVDEGNE